MTEQLLPGRTGDGIRDDPKHMQRENAEKRN